MKKVLASLLFVAIAAVSFTLGRSTFRVEPEAAGGLSLREALRAPDPLSGLAALTGHLEALDAEGISNALESFESLRASEEELRLFAIAWSRFDAPAAFDRIRTWSRAAQIASVPAVIETWAAQDVAAARGAVDALEDRWLLEPAVIALAVGWSRSGEPGLVEYLAALSSRTRQKVINRLLWKRLKREPAEALMAWVDALPAAGEGRRLIFEKAVWQIAEYEPEAAAAWLDTHADQPYARRAARLVAAYYLRLDTDGALAWLDSLPATPERDEALEWGFLRWLGQEPQQAEAWIRSSDVTPLLWPAVRGYARRLVQSSPEEGMTWCGKISDAEQQLSCQLDVADSWLRRDPEAALVWLARSELPPELRRLAREAPERLPRGESDELASGSEPLIPEGPARN